MGAVVQNERSKRVVGYARVSTQEQNEDGQVQALKVALATEIVIEKASGVAMRPQLAAIVASLLSGDCLVVTEVSRLGRTTTEVLLLADDLKKRGIGLRVTNLGMDTSTPAGSMVLTFMAELASFERALLLERQRRGIDAARARGKHLGRPPLLKPEHALLAASRLRAGETLASIAVEWRVSRRTLSRHLRRHRGNGPPATLPGGKGKTKRRGASKNNIGGDHALG